MCQALTWKWGSHRNVYENRDWIPCKASSGSLRPGQRSRGGISKPPLCPPCLLVPGCHSSLQKMLAEGAVFMIPLPQGFGFTSPKESHNCDPKSWKAQPSLTPLPPHSPTLCLMVTLALVRWIHTWTTPIQQHGRKLNKQQQNLHSFMPH